MILKTLDLGIKYCEMIDKLYISIEAKYLGMALTKVYNWKRQREWQRYFRR